MITNLLLSIRTVFLFRNVFLYLFTDSSIYCNIRGTGPVFILEPPHTLTFLNHKGAIINCLVHGDPDPIVTWVENNGNKQENIPGYLEILRNNSLVFLPFNTGNYRQEIHASNFRCKATNRFGTIVSNIVKVKALVDQHYSTQVYNEYIIEGNTAVFKCHIPSYVKDFVEVNAWIRDDQLRISKIFKKDSRYYITDNGNLHVTNVKSEQDSNSMYKCETKHKIKLSGSIPPKIIDISASISVSAGKTAILPCVSQSNPSPSYRKDWTSINEGSLLIVARKNDSGTYICSASNEMGKEDAVTKITVFSPISVFIHPQNQMVDIGSSISIECVVSGGPVKSMQWFKDGNILKDYDAENILKTLTIDPVKVESVGMYQCFVENQMEVKQASAQITLSAIPPKISKTFKSLRLKPGETLTLHCSASGDPLPTILWKIRDSIVEESGMTHIQSEEINGEVTSTLSVSGITNSDGGIYKCEAVNKISKAFHTEIIQVYGPPKVWPISNKTVIKGDRVVLHCHVSGYPIKAISWFKGRRQLKTSKRMENFQNGSLGINSVNKESDEGKYKCRAENEHGFNSIGTGYLRVIDKPVIMPLSPSAVFKSGGRLNLHCFVSEGDPPIKFSWLLNGLTLPHSLDLTIANTGFSSSLTGMNVNRAHFGNYSCHAKNKAGTVSDQTSVKIKGAFSQISGTGPVFILEPKNSVSFMNSRGVVINCLVHGDPDPSVTWITENKGWTVINEGSVSLTAKKNDSGTYICKATNEMGQEEAVSKVTVISPISVFIHPQIQIVNIGDTVNLECVVSGGPINEVTWMKNGETIIKDKNYEIEMNSNGTLVIISADKESDQGVYKCKAQNSQGLSSIGKGYLSVIEKPSVLPLPSNLILKVRGRLNLFCTVTQGDPPIKFTWHFNAMTLPHDLDLTVADSGFISTLSGMNVNRKHSGNYSCTAENKAGKTTQRTNVKVKGTLFNILIPLRLNYTFYSPLWTNRPEPSYTSSPLNHLDIPCHGKGFPKPQFYWSEFEGDKMIDLKDNSRIVVTEDGALVIKQIQDIDFGRRFVCTISNGINPDLQQQVTLSKLNVITFKNTQKNYASKQLEEVSMKCEVQAPGQVDIKSAVGEWLRCLF
ncbi:Down syndrome cell adhesion molecule-like protein Dscam2 [Nymphon striatum]|nr:Down syndrome cell adhesion molecule-like protein Dscam2 [Nymphon striatum]